MDHKFNALPDHDERIVYVRPVKAEDLPEDMQAEVEGIDRLYAVHNKDGERLAIVQGRRLAFNLARQHDYAPVNVH